MAPAEGPGLLGTPSTPAGSGDGGDCQALREQGTGPCFSFSGQKIPLRRPRGAPAGGLRSCWGLLPKAAAWCLWGESWSLWGRRSPPRAEERCGAARGAGAGEPDLRCPPGSGSPGAPCALPIAPAASSRGPLACSAPRPGASPPSADPLPVGVAAPARSGGERSPARGFRGPRGRQKAGRGGEARSGAPLHGTAAGAAGGNSPTPALCCGLAPSPQAPPRAGGKGPTVAAGVPPRSPKGPQSALGRDAGYRRHRPS